MKRIPKLHSRAGVGMTAFVVLSLPLLLLLLALVINGMAAVATYRRAVALATLGVQTGASSVDFGGTSPSISGNACALAVQAVCENTGGCGSANPKARVSCGLGGNRVTVRVWLKVPLLMEGAFAAARIKSEVQAVVAGGPAYGIETSE